MTQTRWAAALIAALALLSACAPLLGGAPVAEPTPAPTAQPSAAPAPTATSAPTATPSATPSPTATATATPTPSPTAILLTPTATLPPLSADERVALFEQLWTHVRDNYVYRDFRGLDWDAIYAEYMVRVRATADQDLASFYGLMAEMIERLGDEHSRFETPQDVAEEQARFEGELSYVGIGAIVRDVPEGGLITRLARGGPAEQAGIRTRDIILRVGGIPFTDTARFGPRGPISVIRGQPGTSITLTVRSLGLPDRDIEVVRGVIGEDAFPSVEARRLAGTNVGYLLIDTFSLSGLDDRVRDAVEGLAAGGPLDGLIIDVRTNTGGQINLMLNTIGLFVDGGSIGRSEGPRSRYDLEVPAGRVLPATEGVPISILVSEETVSAGEIFASGMQTLGRARIVGTPSSGNTENLLAQGFSDGSRVWLAELIFYRPDGTTIEGSGVQPDRSVPAEWWRYELDADPQVIVAIEDLSTRAGG